MITHFLNFESEHQNPIGSRLKKNPHGEAVQLLETSEFEIGLPKVFDGDKTMVHFLEFVLLMGSLLIAPLLHGFAEYSSNHNGVD
ncbi:hypothetical protein D8674_019675 [Pyrus ussuriensis x Pyrus communis]|uniref:Uncharacterized protein n=1 Tax=Pyrus ussuriensis x Pyrus communis TaxID=2448454 RepID=A0A5N5G8G4_9ROSA|nr:hypothetical protein D8674_019675 [Pyrus ussuriensis x Pyrus communis]